jgi:hypothetical protein
MYREPRAQGREIAAAGQLHPLLPPQVLHFMQERLRSSV